MALNVMFFAGFHMIFMAGINEFWRNNLFVQTLAITTHLAATFKSSNAPEDYFARPLLPHGATFREDHPSLPYFPTRIHLFQP